METTVEQLGRISIPKALRDRRLLTPGVDSGHFQSTAMDCTSHRVVELRVWYADGTSGWLYPNTSITGDDVFCARGRGTALNPAYLVDTTVISSSHEASELANRVVGRRSVALAGQTRSAPGRCSSDDTRRYYAHGRLLLTRRNQNSCLVPSGDRATCIAGYRGGAVCVESVALDAAVLHPGVAH